MELCYRNNPQSLFRKYKGLLTWFANTGVGRDYLGTPRSKISLLLPNGFQEWGGARDYRSTFYTKPVYAKKLWSALQAIDMVALWLKDFDEAQKLLAWELGLTRRMPAIADAVHFLGPFYPDPGPSETTSTDGFAYRELINETWATIIAAAGNNSLVDTANADAWFAQASTTTDQYKYLGRGIFLYDASSIPDTDSIDSGTNSYWDRGQGTGLGTLATALVGSTPASNVNIVAADYTQTGSTRFATDLTFTNSAAYKNYTLNSSGLAAISKTDISKFATRCEKDLDAVAPTWASDAYSYASTSYSETADVTQDPKLAVVHSAAAGGATDFMTMNSKFWGG